MPCMEPYREQVAGTEADRSVVVVALSGRVLGLERTTGQIRWENTLPGGGYGEVYLAFRYGVLVVSATRDAVYRLDYLTGQTLWAAETSRSGRASILVEPDLIFVGKGGYVDAFDHHGRRYWTQPLEGRGTGGLALALPGNIAQADDTGAE